MFRLPFDIAWGRVQLRLMVVIALCCKKCMNIAENVHENMRG